MEEQFINIVFPGIQSAGSDGLDNLGLLNDAGTAVTQYMWDNCLRLKRWFGVVSF